MCSNADNCFYLVMYMSLNKQIMNINNSFYSLFNYLSFIWYMRKDLIAECYKKKWIKHINSYSWRKKKMMINKIIKLLKCFMRNIYFLSIILKQHQETRYNVMVMMIYWWWFRPEYLSSMIYYNKINSDAREGKKTKRTLKKVIEMQVRNDLNWRKGWFGEINWRSISIYKE